MGRVEPQLGLGALLIAATAAASLKGAPLGLLVAGFGIGALAFVWLSSGERPAWLLAAPAALFAFICGMGQAADLAILRLPASAVTPVLAAHDLGAAGVAIAIAAGVAAFSWLTLRKVKILRNPLGEGAGAAGGSLDVEEAELLAVGREGRRLGDSVEVSQAARRGFSAHHIKEEIGLATVLFRRLAVGEEGEGLRIG